MKQTLILVSLLFCLSFSVWGTNLGSYNPEASELLLLPPYCQDKFKGNDRSHPAWKKWSRIFGKDWQNMHHYCAALNFVNRANKGLHKDFNLQRARTNFEYMIKGATPNYILLPDIHVQLGKVYERKGNDTKAAQHFQKAMQLRKDYAPAYVAMSDFYRKRGSHAEALGIAKEGLEAAPKSKALKRRLRELQKHN